MWFVKAELSYKLGVFPARIWSWEKKEASLEVSRLSFLTITEWARLLKENQGQAVNNDDLLLKAKQWAEKVTRGFANDLKYIREVTGNT